MDRTESDPRKILTDSCY